MVQSEKSPKQSTELSRETRSLPDGTSLPDPGPIAITPAMAAVGLNAFRQVAERHGFEGILNCGFIHNAVASAYLAMELQRRGRGQPTEW